MIKLYCFVGKCYIGILEIDKENYEFKFTWENKENYDEGANNYYKYHNFGTSHLIELWLNERVIDDARPDRGVYLSQAGLSSHLSRLDIFLGIHGVSINDTFWHNTTKNNSLYNEEYKTVMNYKFEENNT